MQQPEFMPRAINIEKGFWNKTETKSWLDATIFTHSFILNRSRVVQTYSGFCLVWMNIIIYNGHTRKCPEEIFFPIKHCFDIDQEIKKKN